MKEIIIKLNKVVGLIISEGKLGKVVLFAMITRSDLEGKWDILISTDGLEKNNSEKDLMYVIEQLKKEFINDLSSISQIVLFLPTEDIIKDFARALTEIDYKEGEIISSLKLKEGVTIGEMCVIKGDFSNLDLKPIDKVVKEETITTDKVDEF
jgi:predicted sugar kinase